jgi:hypothetical protein
LIDASRDGNGELAEASPAPGGAAAPPQPMAATITAMMATADRIIG